eukprot:3624827-Rhodomonas_salina.1
MLAHSSLGLKMTHLSTPKTLDLALNFETCSSVDTMFAPTPLSFKMLEKSALPLLTTAMTTDHRRSWPPPAQAPKPAQSLALL